MKIVIVDDDKLVAMSLKMIIEASDEAEVLACGHSGKEAIELYDEYKPDILLMDIRMEEMSGLEAGEVIIDKHEDAKLLFLTTFNDDEYIVKALSIGAKGYIIKQEYESIVPALKAVYEGQTVFGSDVMGKIPGMLKMNHEKGFDYEKFGLSGQEYEIVELVAQGLSNKEIADELCLSEGTVRNYISTILSKLELRDRTNLAIFYYKEV
ncbi:MAG: response regulator transcription factor [Lachnospiraceae bacterium]|jgi:DNA-binding NarL/FixJ family response regulator|nr:response regulator transcription factor [Lachnospiraceae bacterium]